MKSLYVIIFMLVLFEIPYHLAKTSNKNIVIDNVVDVKDFKKLLRTKTNVLVCFTSSPKQSASLIKVYKDTAVAVKGQGTMVLIDCSGEAKKMCKKLKISPDPHILKHYKDGEFHKDYDRRETLSAMVNFMRDPTGDLPWEEDSSAEHVLHISDAASLAKLIRRETKPIMIMFYAPWCGYCKSLKPEYAEAAAELKDEAILAAIDVNRPENAIIRVQYNITGFPTLYYYVNGHMKYQYEGGNTKSEIVAFMKNPHAAPPKQKEVEWADTDTEIVHLTTATFDPHLKEEESVLVMFYAPWCGHCKRMKPEYENAAIQMKDEGINGVLAAVDATKESAIANRYAIKGYPTVKYFSYGEFKFDVNVREAPKIVEFMQNPKEPPPPPPPQTPWSEETSDVVFLAEDTFKPFLKKKKHVLVIFYTPWCGHCKKAKPEFTKAAAHFKDDPKVEFAAVDCQAHGSLCQANDVKGYPTIKYFSYYKVVKSYAGSRTEADFVKFMKDPDNFPTKDSTVPMGNDEMLTGDLSNIVQLSKANFKKVVESTYPTLVMFYAPWCGHCKNLKPEFLQAANDLKKQGVRCQLAMVDCTQNPQIAEEFEIAGFPTLKLFVKGRYVQDFSGTRTQQGIKEFMTKMSKESKEEL